MVAATQTAARSTREDRPPCCTLYHQAVELVGKRWTGAILIVLMDGPLRFSEVKHLVPDLSDRLLSERLKELEAEGIVQRRSVRQQRRQGRVRAHAQGRGARTRRTGLEGPGPVRTFSPSGSRRGGR